jgi:hypothetical protein
MAGLVGVAALDRRWGRYLNALAGLVLLSASFNLRPIYPATFWNDLLTGLLLLAFAILGGVRASRVPRYQ